MADNKKSKRKTESPKSPRASLDTDSLTSFFVPWEKNRAPPIYPNAQTGKLITPTEFLLFFSAVLLSILGTGLISLSTFLIFSNFHYKTLLDISPEIAHFVFPASILCLPCSWMIFAVHNDKKTQKFLLIVMTMLFFSTVLMIIAVYTGLSHKLHIREGDLEKYLVLDEFRSSMRESMKLERKNRIVWDVIQVKLGCCGVDKYTDWTDIGGDLPKSCCGGQGSCGVNSTFQAGCLKIVTTNLAFQTCLFSGINCSALFLQCCVFVIVVAVYLAGKRNEDGDV